MATENIKIHSKLAVVAELKEIQEQVMTALEGLDLFSQGMALVAIIHQTDMKNVLQKAVKLEKVEITYNAPPQWHVRGNAINVSVQEAKQVDGFAVCFSDQGVGYKNPDFLFGIGYNFLFSGMFVINGDFIFDGNVDLVNITGLTSGVCDVWLSGMDENRKCRRISINNSSLNHLRIDDFTENIRCVNNFMDNRCLIRADSPKQMKKLIRERNYRLDESVVKEAVRSWNE